MWQYFDPFEGNISEHFCFYNILIVHFLMSCNHHEGAGGQHQGGVHEDGDVADGGHPNCSILQKTTIDPTY